MLTTQLRIASLRELRHRLDLPQEKFAAKLGVLVRTIGLTNSDRTSALVEQLFLEK